ncbi:MAG: glycosyltransferase [Chthoniobacterales bacterium]|nr:glycosyltransferase [Chthoniobacterales bacterium]
MVPFGINNTVRNSKISTADARRHLGLLVTDRALLFFGQIAPYKGLHYLISACTELTRRSSNYRLVIAGKPKWNEHYWNEVKKAITDSGIEKHIVSGLGLFRTTKSSSILKRPTF